MVLGDFSKLNSLEENNPVVYGSYLGSLDNIISEKQIVPCSILSSINCYYEFSVYDLISGDLIYWKRFPFKTKEEKIIFSYYDDLKRNVVVERKYPGLIYPIISNKNKQEIIVDVYQDFLDSGLEDGNYIVSYNFLKSFTGNIPLTLYDISSHGDEVKVFFDNDEDEFYKSFSNKTFVLKDVYFYIENILNSFSSIELYNEVLKNNVEEFNFVKRKLRIEKDGEFLVKLYSLYFVSDENYYVNNKIFESKTYGIKFIFNKFLFENFDSSVSFSKIRSEFEKSVVSRLEKEFFKFGKEKQIFINFFKNIFVNYFFNSKILGVENIFNSTFYSPFANSLSFGNNEFYPIVKSYCERENGHLINILKLNEPIGRDKINKSCFVFNSKILPVFFKVNFNKQFSKKTIQISPPFIDNNVLPVEKIIQTNEKSDDDLSINEAINKYVDIPLKKVSVDFSVFENFVTFSSARARIQNFKKKSVQYYTISQSISSINPEDINFSSEYISLKRKAISVLKTFDSYERYLFKNGYYSYDVANNKFYSSSFISEYEFSASVYDKQNFNSLLNNLPSYISSDNRNEDFLCFINMTGHFFDVLYQSISGLISGRLSTDKNFDVQKQLLEFFGVKAENLLNGIDNNFYSSDDNILNISSLTDIRRRLLENLIILYKTKGTKKSFEILLNCFGIPDAFLSVEEYGVSNYEGQITHVVSNSKLCLLQFHGVENYVYIDFYLKPKIRTVQFSFLLNKNHSLYNEGVSVPIIECINKYGIGWDDGNYFHVNFPSLLPEYQSRGYYSDKFYPGWKFGFIKLNEHGGVFFLNIPGYTDTASCTKNNRISYEKGIVYTSSYVPFFDGNLYNIRIRKHFPEEKFEGIFNNDNYKIPVICDVTVKRNDGGREVYSSKFDFVSYENQNSVWDGKSIFNVFDQTGSLVELSSSAIIIGSNDIEPFVDYSIGNFSVWDIPVNDEDFDRFCNDPLCRASSYGDASKHLIVYLQEKEPYNFLTYESSLNYIYPKTGVTLSYGYAEGNLENKNDYYPAFLPTYYNVIKSGSWIGEKTGFLEKVESFAGCAKANFTTSYFYGSGSGSFLDSPINVTGSLNGKLSGSFNGIANGDIQSYDFTFAGEIDNPSKWTGSIRSVVTPPFAYFSGVFDGTGSASFSGVTFGHMTSSTFGTYYGMRTDNWVGILTGSLDGIALIGTDGLHGVFNAQEASGSEIFVKNIGNFYGTYNGFWFGIFTGSFNGFFNGWVNDNFIWTASSVYNNISNISSQASFYTGSFCGQLTSSVYSDQNYGYGYFSGAFHRPWTGSIEAVYGYKPYIIYNIKYYKIDDGAYIPLHPKTVSFTNYCDQVHVVYFSSSYPFYFNVINADIGLMLSNYPPVLYCNNKLSNFERRIDTRLDDKSISSYYSDADIEFSSDTNLLGIYLDPQKERNLDIFRYFGSLYKGSMGYPDDLYKNTYTGLRRLWREFFSVEKQKILFNEIYSLYESYIFINVFDYIKDIVPARNNVKYGFVYQQNILERNKYEYKKPVIDRQITCNGVFGRYSKDLDKKFPKKSVNVLYGNFCIDQDLTKFDYSSLPPQNNIIISNVINKHDNIQVDYNINRNYICDILDNFQLTEFFKKDMSGKISGKYNLDVFLKRWKKYQIFYRRNIIDNTKNLINKFYDAGVVWLYDIIKVSSDYHGNLFYQNDEYIPVVFANSFDVTNDVVWLNGVAHYRHKKYTSKNTPNEFITDIRPEILFNGLMNTVQSTFLLGSDVYFEPVFGYPRNHLYHKRSYFSYESKTAYRGKQNKIIKYKFVAGSQNINTTVDPGGLENSSLPVETFVVGRRNIFSGENIINL